MKNPRIPYKKHIYLIYNKNNKELQLVTEEYLQEIIYG